LKDQYFGDVNDFRKYGLLRAIAGSNGLTTGICWMLTPGDTRSDGNLLGYLAKTAEYRHRDPELFDWLKQVIEVEGDRRIARIEQSGLLGPAIFQSRLLADRQIDRVEYFSECADRFSGCDLVFFDPDNGLEIKSRPRGHRNSSKHVYWDEVCNAFQAGSSVLVYQHFIREKRAHFAARITRQLRERTNAAAVFSFRTPRVLFLLASQQRHVHAFRVRLKAIMPAWIRHLAVTEHEEVGGD
jgi:hypothetical protein